MSEPNAKKSKWEEALDRAEASIDWDKLEAKLDEDLKKLTEPVRRKPLISMRGKAHKVFEREVTLPYAHLHLFLHRRTSASCERSAESFSRKGV